MVQAAIKRAFALLGEELANGAAIQPRSKVSVRIPCGLSGESLAQEIARQLQRELT